MAVSDTPWSNFSDSDYSDAEYARACILDRGPDAGTPKQRYSLRVREPSGVLNRNGVHAAAQRLGQVGNATAEQKRAAARKLVSLYRQDLGEDPPESVLMMADMAPSGRSESLPSRDVSRDYFNVSDMHIRSDGGGRIVEAYITPFETRQEIEDREGHYYELISTGAFNRTLTAKGLDFRVLYNHGKTYDGRPDGNLMIPIGVPRLIEPQQRGLYSETEYLDNPLADAALDGIKKGALKGYSFTGRFTKSHRTKGERGGLPLVTRSEINLFEYGPVLYPAYEEARVLGTRMVDRFLAEIDQLDPEDLDRLRDRLGLPTSATPSEDGPGPRHHDSAQDHSVLASHTIRLARMRRGMIPKG